mmetsp:Transcript_2673/g.10612  ORF Transcript_2673/g.10612 Transcript_2673/m.10612 type:complete len:324 (+) Transcript_2673:1905-2876(+)
MHCQCQRSTVKAGSCDDGWERRGRGKEPPRVGQQAQVGLASLVCTQVRGRPPAPRSSSRSSRTCSACCVVGACARLDVDRDGHDASVAAVCPTPNESVPTGRQAAHDETAARAVEGQVAGREIVSLNGPRGHETEHRRCGHPTLGRAQAHEAGPAHARLAGGKRVRDDALLRRAGNAPQMGWRFVRGVGSQDETRARRARLGAGRLKRHDVFELAKKHPPGGVRGCRKLPLPCVHCVQERDGEPLSRHRLARLAEHVQAVSAGRAVQEDGAGVGCLLRLVHLGPVGGPQRALGARVGRLHHTLERELQAAKPVGNRKRESQLL